MKDDSAVAKMNGGPHSVAAHELDPAEAAAAAQGVRLSSTALAPADESKGAEPYIHPASLHLFASDGRSYCYDVTTGTLFEINEFTFLLLGLCTKHSEGEVAAAIERAFPGVDASATLASVENMKRQGMFRFVQFDRKKQRVAQESLWMHRPRRLQLLFAQM